MVRVLLTGANGFVGRQILKRLINRDASVRVVVRTGKEALLHGEPGVDRVISTPSLFQESEEWWAETVRGMDMVIHAAWYVEPGKYLNAPENIDCLAGTLRMARGCSEAGVRRFVGIGSCMEYGSAGGLLSIETPLRPDSAYADSKAATYLALSHWLPDRGVEFAWCRLFYLYGEGEDPRRLVPYLHSRLAAGERADLTSGNQIRDFLDVAEAARKVVDVALGKVQGPVNICSGVAVTVRQLAEQIADEYGRRDLLNFGARPDNLVDPPSVVGVP